MTTTTNFAASDWITDAAGNRASIAYWLPVPGYRGAYEVSTAGHVRSCDRVNVNRNGVCRLLRGQMLRLSTDSEGYQQVGLLRDGREIKARVHRLVALAFVKNPLGRPLVDHCDRDRTNNSVCNLRWVSFSENRRNSSQNPAAMDDMQRLADGSAA